jgi:hypothetical protein
MGTETATVFVNKLGAAERKLNAAIRMFLASEDELAVHSVAADAYQILRDLKGKRTYDDAHKLFLIGLFSIAEELATGKRASIPDKLNHPKVKEVIESFRCGIADGTITSVEEVTVNHDSSLFWNKFNYPANFLKHADQDPNDMLDLSSIKNDEILMRAAGLLVQITNRPTPEMASLMTYLENR